MPLSLHSDLFMTFKSFFICLFRDDFFIVCYRLFALSSLFISLEEVILFDLSLFAPTTYINISGVAKDPFSRFPDVDPEEDDWRQS